MTDNLGISGFRRAAFAVTLAYMLVLQGVLQAMAGGMAVPAAGLPQTILCIKAGAAETPHLPEATDHLQCCTLACAPGFAIAGPIPAITSAPDRASLPIRIGPGAAPTSIEITSDVLPVGSRAPPRPV